MPRQFLGRKFNPNTMTYSHSDGSGGALPEEMRQDMINAAEQRIVFKDGTTGGNGLFVLYEMWKWKDKLGIPK